jgi:hypothetical protein
MRRTNKQRHPTDIPIGKVSEKPKKELKTLHIPSKPTKEIPIPQELLDITAY